MAWAARRRTCRRSWCSAPARKARAAAIAAGAADFCPPSIKACSSAPAAIRCSICPTRTASTKNCSAIRSMRQAAEPDAPRTTSGDPEIATRINSFEMAFRMQSSAPELMDHFARNRSTFWSCTAPSPASLVCQQLPAGATAGGARRALRAALSRGLGPARQPGQRSSRRTATTRTKLPRR